LSRSRFHLLLPPPQSSPPRTTILCAWTGFFLLSVLSV
jgi:hypothetical protein